MRIFLFTIFLLTAATAISQDSTSRGTIHVGAAKTETAILVNASFRYFIPGKKIKLRTFDDAVDALSKCFAVSGKNANPPAAKGFSGFTFEKYFMENIHDPAPPRETASDTVVLKLVVLDDGRYFYKPMPRDTISGQSQNLLKSYLALNGISYWTPAADEVTVKTRFRGATVIVPQKRKLHALGTITIIFSRK